MQMLTQNDRDILRRLADAYMEYALLPVQKEKRDLWKALNRFAPQRPMVNIDQLPWNELEAAWDELRCQVSDHWWRGFELNLCRTLYQWRHFPEDLELTCRCARENGRPLELILKDVSTVRFDPSRLSRWNEIAMEVVTSY